jgi:prophage maintenance system killer protein
MAPHLHIDEGWLSEVARAYVPGDPDVTDFGAFAAAVARHSYSPMGTPVYPEPHHRAAALLHSLIRVPALEHSNQLLGVMVAYAYLQASGLEVKVATDDALDLAAATAEGRLDVRGIAAALKTWIS